MGRLTLNVLLSFAQFEREVTGERIWDKIAASKRNGMWMGGPVPLGYDLTAGKLVPNTKEAALVCRIFSLYLELDCVSKLAARLAHDKITRRSGSLKLEPAPRKCLCPRRLYSVLQNRLYFGEIRHRDKWYAGEHQGIVNNELWKRSKRCSVRIGRNAANT
ncbi:MAG TPA: recombinase family protein [Terriglobales bacterium]|nr:recombinase family protein [Terriglobales bacterium]